MPAFCWNPCKKFNVNDSDNQSVILLVVESFAVAGTTGSLSRPQGIGMCANQSRCVPKKESREQKSKKTKRKRTMNMKKRQKSKRIEAFKLFCTSVGEDSYRENLQVGQACSCALTAAATAEAKVKSRKTQSAPSMIPTTILFPQRMQYHVLLWKSYKSSYFGGNVEKIGSGL